MAIFKRVKKRNLNDYKMELARAHIIVALLSLGIVALLSLGANQQVSFDPTLSAISVVLLLIITILSVCTAVSMYRKK
jgi:hypothetical protein